MTDFTDQCRAERATVREQLAVSKQRIKLERQNRNSLIRRLAMLNEMIGDGGGSDDDTDDDENAVAW